jgi:hypothetical protein
MDALSCLHILQDPLAEEISSSAKDIGRRGGVPCCCKLQDTESFYYQTE